MLLLILLLSLLHTGMFGYLLYRIVRSHGVPTEWLTNPPVDEELAAEDQGQPGVVTKMERPSYHTTLLLKDHRGNVLHEVTLTNRSRPLVYHYNGKSFRCTGELSKGVWVYRVMGT